ncbi:MAG TPA: hypothetical protein VMS21_02910 [Methylomirabilota bacterium]|nr:hypothetical protein [Methylomirabilota bacterium]
MKYAILIAVSASLLAGLAVQRQQLRQLRVENEDLTAAAMEADELKAALLETAEDRVVTTELARLTEANRDLYKLRDEVGRLRKRKQELETLRAENERLLKAKQTPAGSSAQPTPLTPFVPRASLSYRGFATPEAAAETFLWASNKRDDEALRRWDDEALESCYAGDAQAPATDAPFEGWHETVTHSVKWAAREMSGYEIVARRTVADDRVHLGLRLSGANSTNQTARFQEYVLPLRREGSEWKVEGGDRR